MQAEGQRFESVILHELLHKHEYIDILGQETRRASMYPAPVERRRDAGSKQGERWMPRLSEAKKDVISCEKLR